MVVPLVHLVDHWLDNCRLCRSAAHLSGDLSFLHELLRAVEVAGVYSKIIVSVWSPWRLILHLVNAAGVSVAVLA